MLEPPADRDARPPRSRRWTVATAIVLGVGVLGAGAIMTPMIGQIAARFTTHPDVGGAIGDRVDNGQNIVITVDTLDCALSTRHRVSSTLGTFCAVDGTLENPGPTVGSADLSEFTLFTGGTAYLPVSGASAFPSALAPGDRQRFSIAFDVPAGSAPDSLVFRDCCGAAHASITIDLT